MTRPRCSRTEEAALSLLGALTASDAHAFEAHAAACEDCRAELEQVREAMAYLDLEVARADASDGAGAPPDLRAELMRRVRQEDPRPWCWWTAKGAQTAPGLTTVPEHLGEWQNTRFDGVSVRPLSIDDERRFVTMLVKMEAGASYPAHRHAGREECYVIEGDLDVSGDPMKAGDYQVADEGSVHGVQSTRGGCTLLIVSSQDDELIP